MNDPGQTPPPDAPEDPAPETPQAQTPPPVTPATTAVPVTPGPEQPPVDPFPTGYTDEGVPTLDHVREKIEGRWATSQGTTELAEESAAGRDIAEQEAER